MNQSQRSMAPSRTTSHSRAPGEGDKDPLLTQELSQSGAWKRFLAHVRMIWKWGNDYPLICLLVLDQKRKHQQTTTEVRSGENMLCWMRLGHQVQRASRQIPKTTGKCQAWRFFVLGTFSWRGLPCFMCIHGCLSHSPFFLAFRIKEPHHHFSWSEGGCVDRSLCLSQRRWLWPLKLSDNYLSIYYMGILWILNLDFFI